MRIKILGVNGLKYTTSGKAVWSAWTLDSKSKKDASGRWVEDPYHKPLFISISAFDELATALADAEIKKGDTLVVTKGSLFFKGLDGQGRAAADLTVSAIEGYEPSQELDLEAAPF